MELSLAPGGVLPFCSKASAPYGLTHRPSRLTSAPLLFSVPVFVRLSWLWWRHRGQRVPERGRGTG